VTDLAATLDRLDTPPPWPIKVDAGRQDLAVYFAEKGYTTGVEIGTLRGEYAKTLCRVNPRLRLIAVDPWIPYEGYHDQLQKTMQRLPDIYEEAQARLEPYHCTLWRKTSAEAAPDIPDGSLDFVFIDGNHAFDYVMQDLTLWMPKVKPGGILSGHDYHRFTRPPYRHIQVIEAVNAFVAQHEIGPWWIFEDGSYAWRVL